MALEKKKRSVLLRDVRYWIPSNRSAKWAFIDLVFERDRCQGIEQTVPTLQSTWVVVTEIPQAASESRSGFSV